MGAVCIPSSAVCTRRKSLGTRRCLISASWRFVDPVPGRRQGIELLVAGLANEQPATSSDSTMDSKERLRLAQPAGCEVAASGGGDGPRKPRSTWQGLQLLRDFREHDIN